MFKTSRKIFLCLRLLVFSVAIYAQHSGDTVKSKARTKHKILLVPLKTTMLMSAIDKAVNTATHFSYNKITASFRSGMDMALLTAFKADYATISLLQEAKKTDTILPYIYASIGYKYDLVSGQDSSGESHAEFDLKKQKTHFIQNGQLQVPIDYSKRFMNVVISNPHLLSYLNKNYDADVFVFVNELDIKNIPNETTSDLSQSNFRREVVVHYSIVNMQKQYITKGILNTYFPFNENNPEAISKKYFSLIAQSMLLRLNKGIERLSSKAKKPSANSK